MPVAMERWQTRGLRVENCAVATLCDVRCGISVCVCDCVYGEVIYEPRFGRPHDEEIVPHSKYVFTDTYARNVRRPTDPPLNSYETLTLARALSFATDQ